MAYTVKLARPAKVNGKRYKVGETVENVSEELFNEMKVRWLVATYETAEQAELAVLPEYKKITADQIEERLTALNVNFEGLKEKKELYALLEETLKGR